MFLIPVKTPSFIRWLFPKYTWKKPTKEKVIYLTFDDGPVPEITPWVLQELEKHNAKATFFCIGENINKNPTIFKDLIQKGHAIGNHTYNHLLGWQTNTKEYLDNTAKAEDVINGNTEDVIIPKKLFRPPFGKIKKDQGKGVLKKGYEIVMWQILTFGWETGTTPNQCLENALKTKKGDIIVFHDSIKASKNMMHTLPLFLKHYSEKGFQFKTLY